jgi:hypothetical protein
MQKVKVIPVSGNCPHKERERLIREADERGKAELRLEQVKMKFNKDWYLRGISNDKNVVSETAAKIWERVTWRTTMIIHTV